jgi:SpoVK/Ycf46/Vps4 family AAA+-type ATPase
MDGGTSHRVLGRLLTWMAENQNRELIVATANDIDSLPPELLRKGRLHEIFFVDLPDADARQ